MAANFVVIATMNPRDKSALQLDAAVKRRMHVISVDPSIDALGSILGELAPADRTRIIDWFSEHMTVLPFGHGLFAGAADTDAVTQTWRGTIIPLLSDATGAISPAYARAYEEFPFR